MADPKLDMPHEPAGNPLEKSPQVDPMLREGRASRWRVWTMGIGIAAIVALVLYGVGTQHANMTANAPQPSQGDAQTQGQGGGSQ